jgi:uncharacterized protein (DUF885 family)
LTYTGKSYKSILARPRLIGLAGLVRLLNEPGRIIMKIQKGFCIVGLVLILVVGCGRSTETAVAPTSPEPVLPTEVLPTSTRETQPDTGGEQPGEMLSQLPTPNELIAGLEGLDFDTFVDQSYHSLMVRNPELLTSLALSAAFGLRDDLLTDISDAYTRQTQAMEKGILEVLMDYDQEALTPEQQLTYDIYAYYLQDQVDGHAFMYDDYPINVTVNSLHTDLLQLFTDIHPVTNQQNAEDYVTRLWQVDTRMAQLVEGLQLREQAGVVLPKFLIDYIRGDIRAIANAEARQTPYYTAFTEKLAPLSSITPQRQAELLDEAEAAINASVIPGYQALDAALAEQSMVATYDEGVWKFPDGEAYYAYLLRHYTTTDLTSDEVHQLGLLELERIHAEMRARFDALGYPANESLPELYSRLATDGGMVVNSEIVSTYEDIISQAEANVGRAFDLQPLVGVIVVGGPTGGYYSAPALDGSRPGMFYAQNTGAIPWYGMPTLSYHEAVPGHHTQIAIAQHLELPSFRRGSRFTAYVEGWALYAERLAWELGFYEGDPYGDLGRLQMEAFRAARLVVDTGLHAERWSFEQAVDFMIENTGRSISSVQAEISRYICIPGQATAYYIGYLRILELRQQMMDAQGDAFDLRAFHNLVLGGGAMPLEVLTQVVVEATE